MSERDLELAVRLGQWGFTFQTRNNTNIQSGDLLSVSVAAHLARTWTINLSAFRFSGGTIVAGQPPDNQTDVSGLVQARIQWGVDAANELALVDYPARGCSFQVHAAVIRLQLVSQLTMGNTAEPLLAGNVAPTQARGTNRHPTFTTVRNNQPASTPIDYPIPARAMGYRIMPAVRNGAADVVDLFQVDGNGAVVTSDGNLDFLGFFLGSAGLLAPNYYPLHPQAQFVRVTTEANPVSSVFAISYQLDLG